MTVLEQHPWIVDVNTCTGNPGLTSNDVLTFVGADVTVNSNQPPWGTGCTCTGAGPGVVGHVTHDNHLYELTLGADGRLTGSTPGSNLYLVQNQAAGGVPKPVLSAVAGIVLGTLAGGLLGVPLAATLVITLATGGVAVLGYYLIRPTGDLDGSSWTAHGGGGGTPGGGYPPVPGSIPT
jgi:hypothetical protein